MMFCGICAKPVKNFREAMFCTHEALMTPTQEQIDAAAEAIKDHTATPYPIARKALTAAAKVEPGDGWQRATELEHRIDSLNEEHRQAVAATIERCAQVAENASIRLNQPGESYTRATRVAIAAAIRALKDKP